MNDLYIYIYIYIYLYIYICVRACGRRKKVLLQLCMLSCHNRFLLLKVFFCFCSIIFYGPLSS